jgi:hypothetical protein
VGIEIHKQQGLEAFGRRRTRPPEGVRPVAAVFSGEGGENCGEHCVLAAEMKDDDAGGEPGLPRHVGNRESRIALARQNRDGGGDELPATHPGLGLAQRRPAAAHAQPLIHPACPAPVMAANHTECAGAGKVPRLTAVGRPPKA